MNRLNLNIRLLIAFGILLVGTLISESFFRKPQPLEFAGSMKQSVELTKKWFSEIGKLKNEKGIKSDTYSSVPYNYMIGDEWSEITTSLGSIESKETSTNPDFSALIIRLLHEAGISKGDKAGVILSGSFPSLAVSVLAALQTMEIEAFVMSSLGASTYGANQPDATWIDMETVLIKQGGLKYKSGLVSIGAGEDAGIGISAEGISDIKKAALRNDIELYVPGSLKESIDKRVELFTEKGISILINIGGNETAIGNCSHTLTIPNGFHTKLESCSDENRGLIVRMNELGIPFINLLYIKELAVQYGITVSPGIKYAESTNLYYQMKSNKFFIAVILIICLIPLFILRKNIH